MRFVVVPRSCDRLCFSAFCVNSGDVTDGREKDCNNNKNNKTEKQTNKEMDIIDRMNRSKLAFRLQTCFSAAECDW